MWPGVNGISTYYPDNFSGYRSHFNTRCKRGLCVKGASVNVIYGCVYSFKSRVINLHLHYQTPTS